MSCEHPKSGVSSSKQQCMHGELARADGKGPWYCMNPDCGFTLWPSAAKEPEIERLTRNILEIDIQRAKRIANLHRASDETTADQPPKKADLSSELFAAWNALNELRRDAEEAEARAFKALDGYEVPPEEPAGALPPAALVISAADDPSHL